MSRPTDKARAAVGALRRANALPDDLVARVDRLGQRLADAERELTRISPQVAAIEARLEDLRERLDDPAWTATPDERTEARALIEEVRIESRRVRARISAATVFEERLRVLEERAGVDSATGRPRD